MANATISYKLGATTYTFVIEGLLNVQERKTQQSIPLPFPFLSDDANVINSIFGQTRTLQASSLIMLRDDDYTNGTGAPSTYSSEEQKDWLLDNIFKPTGYHVFTDESGKSYNGRIEDMQVIRSGDDPIKHDLTFTFTRGVVPAAGQFTPF